MPVTQTKGAASSQGFGEFAKAGPPPLYVEDVFSTYLYTGNGSTQTITNGIDLAGKGGMVWMKGRAGATNHALYDTARGVTKDLVSNNSEAETTQSTGLTAFSSSGFSIGALAKLNTNASTYVSWTFRKAAKFFDVVTYTGNGSSQTINHNLGSVPGVIIVKRTNITGNWQMYHRSLGNTKALFPNTTDPADTWTAYWNNTSPTATQFTVGSSGGGNAAGDSYVAYLFAHDAGGFGLSGTDNVISCGSYTGNGSVTGPSISLGYEPQWVMIKSASIGNWIMLDIMRGMAYTVGNELYADLSAVEITQSKTLIPTATGFDVATTDGYVNNNGTTYTYIAIRRGPMKTPTSGTSVYNAIPWTGNNAARIITGLGFPLDACFTHIRNNGGTSAQSLFFDRLRGAVTTSAKRLAATSTAAETDYTSVGTFDLMNGFRILDGDSLINDAGIPSTYIGYFLRRAPGFFDVVCYTGTGSATTQAHGLQVVPELMIVKIRNGADSWIVYHSTLGATKYVLLNTTGSSNTDSTMWNNTTPTASVFSVGAAPGTATNLSGSTYVAYLFATVAGVSKVGSYTGTGAAQTINCGFTAGARFVLIKRTDSTGGWYVYDSARGITSGNDPYLLMNSTAAEVTTTDYVDTDATGFKLTSSAPAALNANGGTFIYLAIA